MTKVLIVTSNLNCFILLLNMLKTVLAKSPLNESNKTESENMDSKQKGKNEANENAADTEGKDNKVWFITNMNIYIKCN